MRSVKHELKGERVQEPEAALAPVTALRNETAFVARLSLTGRRSMTLDLTPTQVIVTLRGQTQTV
jgi:hypothetical protein